ncbi:glycogen debranching N-terminal domain-containing protein [Paenarthrobacter ureafaciens]|jgi:glycogen debranching enzyme|uniref:amylo-alpha-1,6-glucosidase n=1 Tax=Paenarthrobacter TaxID=1742992 RepID=UPI00222E55B9|nr:glycogen debranching N-terminal domain-containing protein [Paenarthrobacter sp. PAE-2]MCW3767066.1 amylo-alpha-1,6-glucosidase [Paenarthrobacter sp. PAE-2]
MTAWNADTEAGASELGAVTVVEGSSFCISSHTGDVHAGGSQGAYYQDTRIVSRWVLRINGEPREPLVARNPTAFQAEYVGRACTEDGRFESPLLVQHQRSIGSGLRDDITIRNYSGEPSNCTIEVILDADLADLFDVKGGRAGHTDGTLKTAYEDRLYIESRHSNGQQRGVSFHAEGAKVTEEGLTFNVTIPARTDWTATVIALPITNGKEPENPFTAATPLSHSVGAQRHEQWEEHVPRISVTDINVTGVLEKSQRDLGSLRIFDAKHPDRAAVAAGAPWFMALFGRDSLLASYMSLMVDPSLAAGTLQTLAGLQGTKVDIDSEEEPGRIPHEVRLGVTAGLSLGGTAYYGTADATPLFVSTLGELSRWGLGSDIIESLLPHADRAIEWMEKYGDRDGDGFIEYQRPNPHGLINQGWKDSWDGINFADGTMAEAPIALCEVQAYAYAAYVGRSLLARAAGDTAVERRCADRAEALKEAFNKTFWLPDEGYYALALDKDKKPVDSCTSNMGHCLWVGIVDEDKAPLVAERLMSPEMFTGWGIRTLASDMGAYNPVSYHNGSVWPHDTAIVATGLMRYGFVEEASRVASGLFDAAKHFGGRLPELFCGFDRSDFPEPVPYPTACSPQAWAAAAPVQLARILLRFDPDFTRDVLHLAPILPASFGTFSADNVLLGDSRITIEAAGPTGSVAGLPESLRLRNDPRPPLAGDLFG